MYTKFWAQSSPVNWLGQCELGLRVCRKVLIFTESMHKAQTNELLCWKLLQQTILLPNLPQSDSNHLHIVAH
jgi:hypothetical protein